MSGFSCGIIGLPNVGKSTLFNALTKKRAAASNYPFCTIDPNVGIVEVPDTRLDALAKISHSKKMIAATVTFVDIAGLVKGAAQGEGLGNKFLSHIRETDAVIQVVRCFENEEVIHVEGKVDPIKDIEIINLELILADLQMAENSKAKLERQAKGNKEIAAVVLLFDKIIYHLNANKALRSLLLNKEEEKLISNYAFLTRKKQIYLANVSEKDLPHMDNAYVQMVREYASKEGSHVLSICAKLEAELSELHPEDAKEFLHSLGLQETGLSRLIKMSYAILDLISFLTTGEQETRAWTIKRGTTAVEAAGKIHSDIEKGFIRAEVISYDDMIKYGGRVGAREAGKARSEGRDYIVQDGDVILFFHH